MTEEQASNAVDQQPAAPAVEQPVPDAPVIDTSWLDNTGLSEPMLKGPCSPVCTIAKFSPAIKADSGEMYGMSLDLVLDEPVDDNQGGQIPVGKSFNYMKVFTAVTDKKPIERVNRIVGNMIAALNGIVIDPKTDPGDRRAKAALAALPPLAKTPSPQDRDQSHYDQHVGKKVKAHLKPNGVDKNGFPQVDLMGLSAVPGTAQSPY